MIKTGIINSAYYFDDKNKKTNIDLLKKHGFTAINFQGFSDPASELYTYTDEQIEEIFTKTGKEFADAGVEITQAHGLWPTDDTTEENRESNFKRFVLEMRACKYLGCKHLVIHPIMPFGRRINDPEEEIYRINKEFFTRLLPYAKENGVTICVENMPFTYLTISRVATLKKLITDINDDNFKACLDTGHANVCHEDIGEAVRTFGDDLRVLHVHDNNTHWDEHLIPYQGYVNWDKFLSALKEIGFKGDLSIEMEISRSTPQPMLERMQEELGKIALYMAEKV